MVVTCCGNGGDLGIQQQLRGSGRGRGYDGWSEISKMSDRGANGGELGEEMVRNVGGCEVRWVIDLRGFHLGGKVIE